MAKNRSQIRYVLLFLGLIVAIWVIALLFDHKTLSVQTPGAPTATSSSVVAAASGTTSPTQTPTLPAPVPPKTATPTVLFNNSTVVGVTLADTEAEVQQGLSGTASLGASDGMLFLFAKPAIYRFWMPDMFYPLDMIWINGDKVVDISANVTNAFKPSAPTFYMPDAPVRYILEVNAGFAAAHGIVPGSTVVFKNVPSGGVE